MNRDLLFFRNGLKFQINAEVALRVVNYANTNILDTKSLW